MTDTFVASNGVTLDRYGLAVGAPGIGLLVELFNSEAAHPARIEFYRHLEDERLGRWRWPDNPDYVVYPKSSSETEPSPGVRVIHESSGRSKDVERVVTSAREVAVSVFGKAARAYFETHPERKPWHDAKRGEVWVVTESDLSETYPYLVDDEQFYDSARDYALNFTDPAIIAARRIWPEDAS